jgi:hypothetical protein
VTSQCAMFVGNQRDPGNPGPQARTAFIRSPRNGGADCLALLTHSNYCHKEAYQRKRVVGTARSPNCPLLMSWLFISGPNQSSGPGRVCDMHPNFVRRVVTELSSQSGCNLISGTQFIGSKASLAKNNEGTCNNWLE